MDSSRGVVVLVVFAVILAVAGIVFVAGSGKTAVEPAKPPVAAPAPAPIPAAAPKAPVTPPPSQESAAPAKVEKSQPAPQAKPGFDETQEKPDPRLVVPTINEPEMPLEAKAGDPDSYYAKLPKGSGYLYERASADGKDTLSGVVVPGTVLVTKGIVELFGCGGGGKEHETVIRLDCDIQTLDMALTLAAFKRGPLPEKLGIADPKQGSRVIIVVQWNDRDGKTVSYRSEDLVVSIRRDKTMPRVGWTYVAKWTKVSNPVSTDPSKTDDVLGASMSKSLVCTFRDESALLDNPLPEADDDTMFAANYMILPRGGTPVRVIFRSPTAGEREEMGKLEKDLTKEASLAPPKHDHKDEKQ
jgi:hypothetical protein